MKNSFFNLILILYSFSSSTVILRIVLDILLFSRNNCFVSTNNNAILRKNKADIAVPTKFN